MEVDILPPVCAAPGTTELTLNSSLSSPTASVVNGIVNPAITVTGRRMQALPVSDVRGDGRS